MQGIIPRIVGDIFSYIYQMDENLEFHIKVIIACLSAINCYSSSSMTFIIRTVDIEKNKKINIWIQFTTVDEVVYAYQKKKWT